MPIGELKLVECTEALIVGAPQLTAGFAVAGQNAAVGRQLTGQFGLLRPPGNQNFNTQPVVVNNVEWGPPVRLTITIGPTTGIDRNGQLIVCTAGLTATLEVSRQEASSGYLYIYLESSTTNDSCDEKLPPTDVTPQIVPAQYRLILQSEAGIPLGRLKTSVSRNSVELDRMYLPSCVTISSCDALQRHISQLLTLTEALSTICITAIFRAETQPMQRAVAQHVLHCLNHIQLESHDIRNDPARVLTAASWAAKSVHNALAITTGLPLPSADQAEISHLGDAFGQSIQAMEFLSQRVAAFLGRTAVHRGEITLARTHISHSNGAWNRVCLELSEPLSHFTHRWNSPRIRVRGKATGLEQTTRFPLDPVLPSSQIERRLLPLVSRQGGAFRLDYTANETDLNAPNIAFFVPPFVTVNADSLRADILVTA